MMGGMKHYPESIQDDTNPRYHIYESDNKGGKHRESDFEFDVSGNALTVVLVGERDGIGILTYVTYTKTVIPCSPE
jgi:hypothetical protein